VYQIRIVNARRFGQAMDAFHAKDICHGIDFCELCIEPYRRTKNIFLCFINLQTLGGPLLSLKALFLESDGNHRFGRARLVGLKIFCPPFFNFDETRGCYALQMIRKLFRFVPNYLVLLIEVALGSHQTNHPLGVRWRWRHWRDN
jgi:hypothetical protein